MSGILVMDKAMLVSGIILAITFIGIFTENLHGFHRAKFAMLGAIVMIIAGQYFGFYDPTLAVHAVDWNVVFLLGCMMAIISVMITTGGFEVMASTMARISKGINISPLWWALAVGVGMGGNGTHIGSTANVYIVTISERLAQREKDPSLAITPGVWFRTGTPAMLVTLIVSSFVFYFFFDFFNNPV